MPPKQQCQTAARSRAPTVCRATTTIPVIYQPHVGCEGWHWHLPQVTPDPPAPLRAPSSRWGLWGGSLSQPGRVRRKKRDTSSPWAGHGHCRGAEGTAPVPGLSHRRCVLRALSVPWRAQEPSRAVPALELLLPAPSCGDSHMSRTHPSLPSSCQALPGRGRSPTGSKGQNSHLPSSASSSLPRGPKARGQLPHSSVGAPSPRGQGGTGGCPGREREAATAPALAAAWSH